jgi:hypothetical protein
VRRRRVAQLIRLRRPVDLDRIVARGELPDRPAKARVQLDGVSDYRRGIVQRVLADARIELDDDADLVLGRGSAVVEALAEGRAAYVYGDDGGDGWVTPERYELLEADGFSGRAEPSATTFERLRAELDHYDPALGPAGRELAQAHDARARAGPAAAFDGVTPRRDPVDAPLRGLARVVRLEAAAAAVRTRTRGRPSPRVPGQTQLERELAEALRAQRAARARGRGATPPGEAAALEEQRLGGRRAVASARAAERKVPHLRDDRFASPRWGCETHGRTPALRPSSSLSTSMAADRKLLAAAFAAIAFLTAGPARGAVMRPTQTAPAAGAVVQFLPSFAWTPVAGADKYEFQISADAGMNSPVLGIGKDDFFTRNTRATLARRSRRTYYWRVRATKPPAGSRTGPSRARSGSSGTCSRHCRARAPATR